MTFPRDPSLRVLARERYHVLAEASSQADLPAVASAQADAELPLIERVHALYADPNVPVREIARLVGVSERTIYKYARKLNWTPRVVRLARGAGGRFIPRADAGKPHAHGLKALDPAGAQQAALRCARAGVLSAQATAEVMTAARRRAARAQAAKDMAAELRALDLLTGALLDLAKTQNDLRGERRARLGRRLQGAILRQLAHLISDPRSGPLKNTPPGAILPHIESAESCAEGKPL